MPARFLIDPQAALNLAAPILERDPVRNNLPLSLLDSCAKRGQPVRFWVGEGGIVLQTSPERPLVLSFMSSELAVGFANTIAESEFDFPGVNGAAECASAFAGQWAERRKVPAAPHRALRLYELIAPTNCLAASGGPSVATPADRELMIEWLIAFGEEIGEPSPDVERLLDSWLADDLLWVWEDEGAVSMAGYRKPMAGVSRIGPVYTPTGKRGRGYAGALVYCLSRHLVDLGLTCVLYTDLANPVSNSIYRRIGYRSVFEAIQYRFGVFS